MLGYLTISVWFDLARQLAVFKEKRPRPKNPGSRPGVLGCSARRELLDHVVLNEAPQNEVFDPKVMFGFEQKSSEPDINPDE
ncbi:MAG: hypothetical protein GY847_34970 [Proteobacteria bacterium]|nr:hypothetical protein [Pseudomonadota bacterium]